MRFVESRRGLKNQLRFYHNYKNNAYCMIPLSIAKEIGATKKSEKYDLYVNTKTKQIALSINKKGKRVFRYQDNKSGFQFSIMGTLSELNINWKESIFQSTAIKFKIDKKSKLVIMDFKDFKK